MEKQDLFDALTIRFSEVRARRDVLRTVAKLGLAMVVFGAWPWRVQAQGAVDGESLLVKGCRLPGQKCTGKKDCCANKCTNKHRCGCVSKGREPLVDTPLGPVPVKALCCSNKIHGRSNTCR
jgi:hypothetical protein